MDIVKQSTHCYAVIDELPYYDELYRASGSRPRSDFYDISTPFLMDSQATKLAQLAEGCVERRVRKRRKRLAQREAPNFLSEICTVVSEAHRQYLQDNRQRLDPAVPNWADNNRCAREAVKMAPSHPTMPSSLITSEKRRQELEEGKQYPVSEPSFFRNAHDTALTVGENSVTCAKFLIPARAEFTGADVETAVEQLIEERSKFDLIVMDPPWPNRSVKRKRTYECFQIANLRRLRIDELLAEDGLLCIWLTNSESVHVAAKEILHQQWGLAPIVKWHWLKICKTGQPVFTFNPAHKVPFESILFACRDCKLDHYRALLMKSDYCLIGVPNANPSRKPPLGPILQQLGVISSREASTCRALELYARYLLPNTVSVGHEVLKFQHHYFFFISAGDTNTKEQQ